MKRPLTEREKRLIRLASVATALYLAIFYGQKGYAWLEARRGEYAALSESAEGLRLEILREQTKALRVKRAREATRIDLASLREDTVVGESRAAIQKAAQECGVAIVSSREMPGQGTARSLAMVQLDGQGPTVAVLKLIHRMRSLGYPVSVDRLQLNTAGLEVGNLRFSMMAVIFGVKEAQTRE